MPYSSVKGTLPAISVKTPAEVRISGSETDFSDYEGGGEKESTLTARVRQCSLQAINSVIDVSVTSAAVKKWETSFLFLSFSFSLFFFLSFMLSFLLPFPFFNRHEKLNGIRKCKFNNFGVASSTRIDLSPLLLAGSIFDYKIMLCLKKCISSIIFFVYWYKLCEIDHKVPLKIPRISFICVIYVKYVKVLLACLSYILFCEIIHLKYFFFFHFWAKGVQGKMIFK